MNEFQIGADGVPFAYADPQSDLDYSIACWIEGVVFLSATWAILPAVASVPYNSAINAVPVTIDGKLYDIGKVASAWVKNLVAGTTYTVTVSGIFSGNRKDDRTFKLICKER